MHVYVCIHMCLGTHVQVCAYVRRLEVNVRDFFNIIYFLCIAYVYM